jgi:phage terminase large subunit-like protein
VTASVTLVEPAYFTHPDYADTLGPEVADLAEIVGFPADPEQRLVLDAMFGLDRVGRRVAFEVAVIGARQNIKTGLFKIAALGEAFIAEVPLLVWSAHEFPTAQEAFRDLSELIESSPDLDREIKHIHRGNGDEAIELLNGCRIKFKARTKSGGRGLSGKRVVLDEAFALQPTHMGALLPMLSAQDEPQVWYGSSAGLADSEVLRGIRDRGRKGSRSMVYVEWCAPKEGCATSGCSHMVGSEGCILDDEAYWQMANPQMGRRIRSRRSATSGSRSRRRSSPESGWAGGTSRDNSSTSSALRSGRVAPSRPRRNRRQTGSRSVSRCRSTALGRPSPLPSRCQVAN